ncbi:MAG: glycosyltransferase family 2 protein [Thermodesulfovibrionales bacterium]
MVNNLLSIVIPIYNEGKCIDALWQRLRGVEENIRDFTVEYVFVNDGSVDDSLRMLKHLAAHDARVKILSFSRNFGHQIAITAGIDYAGGEAVIVMDADLQDPPELICDMLEQYREGYDVVYAVRRVRKGETYFKRRSAEFFYKIMSRLSLVSIPPNTGDFRLMSRRVVASLSLLRERDRFVRGMISWVGFKQTGIEFDRDPRLAGETKYPLRKMMKFAFDGIVSFSNVPLKLATWMGFITSFFSLVYIFVVLVKKFLGHTLPGYASLMISILFLGGVQLITIGILGEYIGRIYNEAKARPLYLLEETVNIDRRRSLPEGGRC